MRCKKCGRVFHDEEHEDFCWNIIQKVDLEESSSKDEKEVHGYRLCIICYNTRHYSALEDIQSEMMGKYSE